MSHTRLAFLSDSLLSANIDITNPYITEHIEKISNPKYKTQSEHGYKLLSFILKKHYSIDINQLVIAENEFGKPCFKNSDLHFNISHSHDAVVCSVSEKPIGVDIEIITEIRPKILDKYFTLSEKQQISTPVDFYKLWTLKEAYGKLRGIGVSIIKDNEFEIAKTPVLKSKTTDDLYIESKIIDNYALSIISFDEINNLFIIK